LFSYFKPYLLKGHTVIKKPLIILLLWLPLITFSQSVKDSVQDLPHAIKNTEIADYRINTKNLIDDTRLLLLNLEKLESFKSQIIKGDSIFSTKLATLKDSLSRLNLAQLDRIKNQVQEYNSELNTQKKNISDWRIQTNKKQQIIDFDLQNWQITNDSLKTIQSDIKKIDQSQLNILENVNGQVTRSLEGLAQLQTKFNIWNNQLIETENALTAAQGEINEINSLLNSKRKEVLNNIWIPEYAPIWTVKTDDYSMYYTKFKSIIHARIQRLKEHYSSRTNFYFSVFFSFIFILSLIIFIKIKSHKDVFSDTNALSDPHLIVKYPILSTLIILSFFIYIFYSIPFELKTLIFLISIIPFAVLIWELNSEKKLFTVGFFIFYSLIFAALPLLNEYPFLLRYSLLFINSLSLLILLLLRKNKELIEKEKAYWLGFLPVLISIFIFLNILAIIGNIIGNVQLSVILTETIIGTFLAFAIIKESVKLVHSFLYLLITQTLVYYSNIIKDDNKKVLFGLYKFLKYASFFIWLYLILGFLKVRNVLTEYFLIFINKPLKVGELSISLGNVIAFFLIIQLSLWISQFIRYVLDKEVYPRTSIDKGVASTFSLMIRYTLMVIGFALALAGAGIEYSSIAIGMGALGIGIGFGLQNIFSNFMSGIILAIERPIKTGDIVKIGEVEGEVKDIGLRASQIKTFDGADVIVPNSNLISEKLVNWTFNDRKRRLEIEVKLDLDSDIVAASKVILYAIKGVPKLLKTPSPIVNFEGVKDGAAVIKVYGWINNFSDGIAIGTSFKIATYQALKNNGFKLANPILDVNVNENKSRS
jgi:small-conductance mechanosensitive channel